MTNRGYFRRSLALCVFLTGVLGARTFVSGDTGSVFLLAYYDSDRMDRMRVFRWDQKTGRGAKGDLRVSATCLGAVLNISEENGLVAVTTHVTPSATCVLLFDSKLRFREELAGWLFGRVGGKLIVGGNTIHFAPTHPESFGIYDPATKKLTPIYPAEGDARRKAFAERLRKHMPSEAWCREFNNPCDPDKFTTDILQVKVNAARDAFSFDVRMSAEGMVKPVTVGYECALRSGVWVVSSR